ncbi:MAG TPA: aromatic ring-hydroxylating dioxygenase subunit alpha [Gaiellaceae bacterium]|nr:aromatic ring-hydroxylating dioxygenase subunit alpha [Gaiellaceae bacterium]
MAAIHGTRTLPWSWYTDPAALRLEQEQIFRRSWQYVGHAGEVPEPGSFAANRVADVPVVLVRDEEGTLRAFLNVCRHRGSIVCDGSGRRRTLQCPYHAWTYGLDGRLLAAPRLASEGDDDREELGLVPLRLASWGPLLFVNPDPEAAPLEEVLDGTPKRIAEAGIDVDALRFLRRWEYEVDANWKIVAENFLECYHCPTAHPGFSAVMDVSPDAYLLETSAWRMSQHGAPRPEPRGGYDPSGEIGSGQFHLFFPGTVVNVMPGRPNLSIGPIYPLAPERTYRFLDYFVDADADDEWVRDLLEFDAQVGVEDRALVERVQAGVRSGVLGQGRLMPESERLVAHFQRLVLDALAS